MNSILVLMMAASIGLRSNDLSPQHLRSLYYQASKNSSDADKFYDLVKDAGTQSPLLLGYKGMAEFMKCYHSYNPVSKLNYFYKGKQDLDHAITLTPNNVELRYLRFTVQTNLPPFLNYRSEITSDKDFLIHHIGSTHTDTELRSMICEYMIKCDFCSNEEKTFFQNIDYP